MDDSNGIDGEIFVCVPVCRHRCCVADSTDALFTHIDRHQSRCHRVISHRLEYLPQFDRLLALRSPSLPNTSKLRHHPFRFLRGIIPLQPLDFHGHGECSLSCFFSSCPCFLRGANVSPYICSISGNRGGKSPLTRDFGNSYRLTIPVPDNCPNFLWAVSKKTGQRKSPTFSSGWGLNFRTDDDVFLFNRRCC